MSLIEKYIKLTISSLTPVSYTINLSRYFLEPPAGSSNFYQRSDQSSDDPFSFPPEHSPSPLMRIYQHWIKTVSALKSLITNQKMVTIAVALSKMLHAITLISASLIRCQGLSDGLNTGTQTGSSIFLQYLNPLDVSDLMALADTTTIFRDGDKFIGSSLNEAMLDLLFGDDRLDTIQLNDITFNIV